MIVRSDMRRTGIGRKLMVPLEQHAANLAYTAVWVATGGPAVGFYERCGYRAVEAVPLAAGGTAQVLMKQL